MAICIGEEGGFCYSLCDWLEANELEGDQILRKICYHIKSKSDL